MKKVHKVHGFKKNDGFEKLMNVNFKKFTFLKEFATLKNFMNENLEKNHKVHYLKKIVNLKKKREFEQFHEREFEKSR